MHTLSSSVTPSARSGIRWARAARCSRSAEATSPTRAVRLEPKQPFGSYAERAQRLECPCALFHEQVKLRHATTTWMGELLRHRRVVRRRADRVAVRRHHTHRREAG